MPATPSIKDHDILMRIRDHPLRSEKPEEEGEEDTLEVHTIDKVTELVHTCLELEKEQITDVPVDKKFQYRLFLEGHVQDTFNSTVDIMLNMEDISTGTAKKYYQYRVTSLDEMKVQAEEVTREYKSGMMDPSRDAAIYEKMNSVKKKDKKPKA